MGRYHGDQALDIDSVRAEFVELAESADAEVIEFITGKRAKPESKYFIGSGRAEEIAERVAALEIDLVLVNHPLSPTQERNLEALVCCRVLDRTGLILDIFAKRARTFEGKLQVELAQYRHLATRLVRGWTHLERQKGGIGLRGPGETQLETDRRLVTDKIRRLESRLKRLAQQRQEGRKTRLKADLPTVALVGYTNAGKSTFFNQLAGADAYVADQLFATLDPTLRRVDLATDQPAVLADTVGFVSDLPHELVAAFRATLEEAREAEILLHVIDSHDPERRARMSEVMAVLEQIDAHEIRQIEVYNKIDLTGEPARIEYDEDDCLSRAWVSAATGEGMEALREALADDIRGKSVSITLLLDPSAGKLRARLFELGVVQSESYDEQGRARLDVKMSKPEYSRLSREFGLAKYLA